MKAVILATLAILTWPSHVSDAELGRINKKAFEWPVLAGLHVQWEQDGQWYRTGYVKRCEKEKL